MSGTSSRREFLALIASGAVPLVFRRAEATDETIILKALHRGLEEELFRHSPGDLVAESARGFLGRPYQANTLEEPGEEHLVVNLRSFDCVTLCETSLALARAIKLRASTTAGYTRQLELIRYRSGVIGGYPSRLHYFSDWIADNEKKNVLKNVTSDLGGERDGRALNFMSTHRDAYPHLSSEENFSAIAAVEMNLSALPRYVLPKERVRAVLEKIQNGDIIAVTTSVEGLDVSHTGIAVREGGTTKLLHAPNVGHQVQVSRGSLADYLDAHEKQSGIMVARPLVPR